MPAAAEAKRAAMVRIFGVILSFTAIETRGSVKIFA
jgi:hypothetical protein